MSKVNIKTRSLVTCGILAALGVLLPQAFHMFGQAAGGMFLPMHIPVFVAAMLLGWYGGLSVGVVSVVLSFLLFSMPGVQRLPFMLIELSVYGIATGLIYRKTKRKLFSMVTAMVFGRVVYAVALLVSLCILKIDGMGPVLAWNATVSGLPGIALQLIVVPLTVKLIESKMKWKV